jgi:hypothetical protein
LLLSPPIKILKSVFFMDETPFVKAPGDR